MPTSLTALAARLDACELRTRLLIFATGLTAVWFAWDALLYQPLDARRVSLETESGSLHRDLQELYTRTSEYLDEQKSDPDALNRGQLQSLRSRAEGAQAELSALMSGLVPPQEVPRVLERMLGREAGLTLVRLEGLGPKPVIDPFSSGDVGTALAPADGSGASEPGLRLFKHGMKITFEGRYLEALRYLAALEGSPWKLFWDAVELEVIEHPTALVSITVFSLSTDDAWIGV